MFWRGLHWFYILYPLFYWLTLLLHQFYMINITSNIMSNIHFVNVLKNTAGIKRIFDAKISLLRNLKRFRSYHMNTPQDWLLVSFVESQPCNCSYIKANPNLLILFLCSMPIPSFVCLSNYAAFSKASQTLTGFYLHISLAIRVKSFNIVNKYFYMTNRLHSTLMYWCVKKPDTDY